MYSYILNLVFRAMQSKFKKWDLEDCVVPILQGETIKLSSLRKQYYSFILKVLLEKSIQLTWLCSRADIYSM